MSTSSHHSLSLMACVRESSPQESIPDSDPVRNEGGKKRRFLRGLRRIFRRKGRQGDEETPPPPAADHRSRSTSELLADHAHRRSSSGLYPTLSVSHDSVFTAEQRTPDSSSEGLSSASVSMQRLPAELLDAVRKRRPRGETSESEEDLGLPRSPCNSPSSADVLDPALKEIPTKSRSTCSDGSLLSMGSSEMDEDSVGPNSGHSSKVSLQEKKIHPDNNDSELDIDVSAPLSHSAARHKMSVRPKRTHGAPRKRRVQQISAGSSLPTTPEVNEDAPGRSSSPDARNKEDFSDETNPSAASRHSMTTNLASMTAKSQVKSASLPPGLALPSSAKITRSHSNAGHRQTELQPLPTPRTRSSSELNSNTSTIPFEVLTKTKEMFGTVGEEEEQTDNLQKDDRKEESFFGRLLSRRSNKKKKEKSEEDTSLSTQTSSIMQIPDSVIPKRFDEKGRYSNESSHEFYTSSGNSPTQSQNYKTHGFKFQQRSTAASRQRVQPINLPPSPDVEKKDVIHSLSNDLLPDTSTEKHSELSTREPMSSSHTRMQISYSVSPPTSKLPDNPPSPSKVKLVSLESDGKSATVSKRSFDNDSLSEKSRLFSSGLSAFNQQSKNELDNEEREFNSLITTSEFVSNEPSVKKSRSFRGDINFSTSSYNANTINENKVVEATLLDSHIKSIDIVCGIPSEENNSISEKDELDTVPNYKPSQLEVTAATTEMSDNANIQITRNIENIENKSDDSSISHSWNITSFHVHKDTCTENSDKCGEVKGTSLKELGMSNLTKQVTGPIGNDGISITQTVPKTEENCSSIQEQLIVQSPSDSITLITDVNESIGKEEIQELEDNSSLGTDKLEKERDELSVQECKSNQTENELVPTNNNTTNLSENEKYTPSEEQSSVQENKKIEPDNTTINNTTSNVNRRSIGQRRESRPIAVPEPQVPEFLKVQLNRVDSRPSVNVVLSTNTVFEYEKIDSPRISGERYIRQKSSEDKNLIKLEEKLQIKQEFDEPIVKAKNIEGDSVSQASSISLKLKRKSSSESNPNIKDMKNSEIQEKNKQTLVQSKTQENERRSTITNELSNKVKVEIPSTDKYSRPLSYKNLSVVSISPSTTSLPPTKSYLNKTSNNDNSVEHSNIVKKTGLNFTDITIVEKNIHPYVSNIKDIQHDFSVNRKVQPWDTINKKDEEKFVSTEKKTAISELPPLDLSTSEVPIRRGKLKENVTKKEETSQLPDTSTAQEINSSEVVLRKKSFSRDVSQKKEEEPELLKVFARRSLKLKDSESELLSSQVTAKSKDSQTNSDQITKSRDSDKENEGGDSPREERKKQPTKEPLAESKVHLDSAETVLKQSSIGITLNTQTRLGGAVIHKQQRIPNSGINVSIDNLSQNDPIIISHRKENLNSPEKRLRSRTIPESPKTDLNSSEKAPREIWTSKYKEKNVELSTTDVSKIPENLPEKQPPTFKRIQQRKEEWEQRAQLASKKTLP